MEINKIQLSNTTYIIIDSQLRQQIANEYNENIGYLINDFCIYNNELYQCIEDTQGSWDSSCWESRKITDIENKIIYYIEKDREEGFEDIIAKNLENIDNEAIFIGEYALANNILKSVNFSNCVSIKANAFYGCSLLQSVNFECVTIGSWAFCDCISLQSVSFPKCTTIADNAFFRCSLLQSVNFSKCVAIANMAFRSCISLQSVSFPNCVKIGISAFFNCSSLQSISFSRCFNIEAEAFAHCTSLQLADFSLCNVVKSYAFYDCRLLQSVNLPMCSTIGTQAFYSNYQLNLVNIPVCETIGQQVFQNCLQLQLISFFRCKTIMNQAFFNCRKLQSIYLLNSSVCTLYNSNAFQYTPIQNSSYLGYYGSIYVPASLVNSYKTATNWVYYANRITAYTG